MKVKVVFNIVASEPAHFFRKKMVAEAPVSLVSSAALRACNISVQCRTDKRSRSSTTTRQCGARLPARNARVSSLYWRGPRVYHVRAQVGPGGDGAGDGSASADLTEWRDFRARLVAQERASQGGGEGAGSRASADPDGWVRAFSHLLPFLQSRIHNVSYR